VEITLPNGTVLYNVPEDMGALDLANIAIANNLAVEDDFAGLGLFPEVQEVFEEEDEELGFFEGVGDALTNIATGTTTGIQGITSGLFSVDNAISDSMDETQRLLQEYLSAQAKNDQQAMAKIEKEAEDKGIAEQLYAAGESLAIAPIDLTAQAVGTMVPQLGAAGVGALVGGPPGALLANRAVATVQGAGFAREAIYDAVYSAYIENNFPEEIAKQKALEAQELTGDNWYQILAGAGLGLFSGVTGVEKGIINKVIGKKVAHKMSQNVAIRAGVGAISEAIPEGLQGAHEALAANTALRNEGFDTPLFRGVPYQGALEFGVGAPLGGITGALGSPEEASGDRFYDRELALTEEAIKKELGLREIENDELEAGRQNRLAELLAEGVSEEEALREVGEPIPLDRRLPAPRIKEPQTAALRSEQERVEFAKNFAKDVEIRHGDSFSSIRGVNQQGLKNYTGDVMDRAGNVIASFDDPLVAATVAIELNAKEVDKTLRFHTDTVIDQAPENYSFGQRNVLRRFARRLLHPDEKRFSIDQINMAAGTTVENGFENEGLSAEEAKEAIIKGTMKGDQLSAAQKINLARIRDGKPVLRSFSVKEAQEALGKKFPSLLKYDVNYDGATYSAETRDGESVVVSSFGDVIKTRRQNLDRIGKRLAEDDQRVNFSSIEDAQQYANALNEASIDGMGPLRFFSELFGKNEISVSDIESILEFKNISSDINSPEIRYIASLATGKRKAKIPEMSDIDRRLVYNTLRNLPKFQKPTRIPFFAPKPYSPAQYEYVSKELIERGAVPDARAVSDGVSAITEFQYKKLIRDVEKDIGVQAQAQEAAAARNEAAKAEESAKKAADLAEKRAAEIEKSEREERKRVQEALNKVMKGFGLDGVRTNVVDFISKAARDADGNLILGKDKSPDSVEGGYEPALNEIFIALESIKANREYTGDNLEQLAISILNHEVLHAMRQLDLITQQEFELLEKLASRTVRPEGMLGAGLTFTEYANQAYKEASETVKMEEAVAELVRAGLEGRLKGIGGKPRSLMKRILEFIKRMFGFKDTVGYTSFSDLIDGISGGQIGARREGTVRSLRVTEKQRAKDKKELPSTYRGVIREAAISPVQDIEEAEEAEEAQEAQDAEEAVDQRPPARGPIGKQAEADFLESRRLTEPLIDQIRSVEERIYRLESELRVDGPFLSERKANELSRQSSEQQALLDNLKNELARIDSEIPLDVGRVVPEGDLRVYHGGTLDSPGRQASGLTFVSEDREQAESYAFRANRDIPQSEDKLFSFFIDSTKLASEPEAREVIADLGIEPVNPSLSSNEANIYELLDPVFEQFVGDENVSSFKNEMTRRGYTGVKFLDQDMRRTGTGRQTAENIVLFDTPYMGQSEMLYSKRLSDEDLEIINSEKFGVTPSVKRGYLAYKSGVITRQEYDEIVLETIKPYTEVPLPETIEQMEKALASNKVPNLYKEVEVKDGEFVGIRLDIPAYLRKFPDSAWVPTVHFKGEDGLEKTSHRATVYIKSKGDQKIDFTKRTSQAAAQLVMEAEEGIAEINRKLEAGEITEEKATKLKKRHNKNSFARIEGEFVERSDRENYDAAVAALNDPEWTQVGYDPKRHSYFYDRKTGEPVTSADEVIQVGPLVLAKNAQRDPDYETRYSKRFEPKHGIPGMYIKKSRGKVSGKTFMPKALNPQNGQAQGERFDELARRHPDPLGSEASWLRFERELLGDNETPPAPTGLISLVNNIEDWEEKHSQLTPAQVKAAKEGFELVEVMNKAYADGDVGPDTTAKLMLWGMLSRMLSAYPHEAAFLDVAATKELSEFIDRAVQKEWTQEDVNKYLSWTSTVLPKLSPSQSATSNLNDFGKIFLKKLSKRMSDGRSGLEVLHDLVSNKSLPTSEVRRRYYALGKGLGIKNKVLSFVLLMTGRNDIVVLDRIQINSMWDAGKFGKLIYDDVATLFDDAHGLARYEAIERSLQPRIQELYDRVGRPKDASVGRYHWESWVRDSGQVVSHPSIEGLTNEIKIDQALADSYADIGASEGRFHQYSFGSVYARDKKGTPYILYPKSDGTIHKFSLDKFKGLLDKFREKGLNKVVPKGFLVTKYKEAGYPWYEAEGVNRDKINELIDSFSEGEVDTEEVVSGSLETKQSADVSRRRDTRSRPKTQRAHSPEQIEKALAKNAKEAEASKGIAVPPYSTKASPEAQYVARNPDAGAVDTGMLESIRFRPEQPADIKEMMDRVAGEAPQPRNQIDIYNDTVLPLGENSKSSRFRYYFDKFRQAFIDRFSRVGYLQAKNRDLLSQTADSSAYTALLNADRAIGVTAGTIKDGTVFYRDGAVQIDITQKSLIEVLSPLQSLKYGNLEREWKTYAIIQRGVFLNEQGKQTPVTKEDIAKAKYLEEAYVDENGESIMRKVYDDWQTFNGFTIQFLQDSGVVDAKTAQEFANSFYYPFYRAAEVGGGEVETYAQNMFGNMTKAATFTKLKGSESAVNLDPTVAITRNLMAAVQMGMNNIAQQRVVRDMLKLGLAREVPKSTAKQNGIVELKIQGVSRKFIIDDPLVFEALMPMDAIEGGAFFTALNLPSNILRETITRTPDFVLANLLRDSLSAYVTTGASVRNVIPMASTLKQFFKGDVSELNRFGLVQGYDLSRQEADITKYFEKERKRNEKSFASKLNPFTAVWDGLGSMTTKSDAATRLAVYKDVLARTANHAEAAFQAQEVMNFGRRGRNQTFRYVTAAVPFLNARIQGLDVLFRALSGSQSAMQKQTANQIKARAFTRLTILTGITFLYWMMMHDEDEYKEENSVTRELNFLIKTPFGVPFKMPTAFEVGLISKVIPEALFNANAEAINKSMGKDGEVFDYTAKQTFDTLFHQVFNVVKLSPLDIQIVGPFIEVLANYDGFTGRSIVPSYIMEGAGGGARYPEEQVSPYSSEAAKIIGKAIDMSPMKVDHLIKGYTGTMGGYASYIVDAIVRTYFSETQRGLPPAVPMLEMPVIRRFFAKEAPSGLRSQVYELSNEIAMATQAMKSMKEAGKQEEAEAFFYAREDLFREEGRVKQARREVDRVRKEIKELIERDDLDQDAKLQEKQRLELQLNDYLLKVMNLPEIYSSIESTPATRFLRPGGYR